MAWGSSSEASKSQKRSQGWQQKMMKTAHQWEMEDFRAAGLNPILTATGGSPGSYSAAAPFGQGMGAETMSSAMDVARTGMTGRRQNPEIKLMEMQSFNAAKQGQAAGDRGYRDQAEGNVVNLTLGDIREKARQNAAQSKAEREAAETNAQLLRFQIPAARAQAEIQSTGAGQVTKKFGDLLRNINPLLPKTNIQIKK